MTGWFGDKVRGAIIGVTAPLVSDGVCGDLCSSRIIVNVGTDCHEGIVCGDGMCRIAILKRLLWELICFVKEGGIRSVNGVHNFQKWGFF